MTTVNLTPEAAKTVAGAIRINEAAQALTDARGECAEALMELVDAIKESGLSVSVVLRRAGVDIDHAGDVADQTTEALVRWKAASEDFLRAVAGK